MKCKRAIIFLLAALLAAASFSSCKGSDKKNTSGSSGSTSSAEDVWIPNDETSSTDSITESTDPSAVSAGSTNNSSKTTTGTSSKTSSNTAVNEAPTGNQYPTTPGDPSTKKMPAFASKLKNHTVKFLSSSAFSATDQLEAFKSLTGNELKIETEVVAWDLLTTTLATRVLSGKAPDMFSIGCETTPYLSKQGYFEKIKDYINMNDGLWADMKDINLYAFGTDGNQYAVTASPPSFSSFILYNKTLFEENELDDPLSLYNKGKWDWEAFYKAAKQITRDSNNDGDPEVLGASMADNVFNAFINSTGKDFVTFKADGTVVSNLKDPGFQRVADFVLKLGKLGIDKESWDYVNRFTQNKIGMRVGNVWDTVSGKMNTMKKKGTIGFVPMPKDPQAKEYYLQAQTYFTYIPKGAANPEGTAAWLYFQRYMAKNTNPALEKKNLKTATETWGWTEAEYTFIYKTVPSKHKFVIPAGDRVPDFSMQNYLWGWPWTQSWAQTVEKVSPSFNAAITAFNKSVKAK